MVRERRGKRRSWKRTAWKAERRSWNVKKNGLHRRPHTYRVNRDSGEKDDGKARKEREREDTEAERALMWIFVCLRYRRPPQ